MRRVGQDFPVAGLTAIDSAPGARRPGGRPSMLTYPAPGCDAPRGGSAAPVSAGGASPAPAAPIPGPASAGGEGRGGRPSGEHGIGVDMEGLALDLFSQALSRIHGRDLSGCPRSALVAVVQQALVETRLARVSALLERVLEDPRLGARLAAAVPAAELGFLGEPRLAAKLRERVMPRLRTWAYPAVWVTSCGAGEAYAMAILLDAAGLANRARVYATDEDVDRLERAASGVLPGAWVRGWEEGWRAAGGRGSLAQWFDIRGESAVAVRSLRSRIVWAQYAPAQGRSFHEFNLIVCRGLLSRLAPGDRRQMDALLADSLCLSGVLFVGAGERPGDGQGRYRALDDSFGLYQRVG